MSSIFDKTVTRSLILCLGLVMATGGAIYQGPLRAESTERPAGRGDLAFWEELAFWESIKDSKDIAELDAYLSAYPDGRFARLAEIRIRTLNRRGRTDPAPLPPEPDSKPDQSPVKEANNEGHAEAAESGSAEPAGSITHSAFRDCEDCPLMIAVPAGHFTMGSDRHRPNERPEHQVTIDSPFAIGVYEVTMREWDACLREGGCRFSPKANDDQDLPVSNLSWDDTQQYTAWLSKKTGQAYRLPTEAEWEYAARGGTDSDFWWGHAAGKENANCKDCGTEWDGQGPAPVGSFKPNPFGLYDVHGNLWEWTMDCANRSYKDAPTNGEVWLRGDCLGRMLRGGSWNLGSDYLRVSRRNSYDRDVRYYLHGFRVQRPFP